jgi:hypothetical protein
VRAAWPYLLAGAGAVYVAVVGWVSVRLLQYALRGRRRARPIDVWEVERAALQLERADDAAIWRELERIR